MNSEINVFLLSQCGSVALAITDLQITHGFTKPNVDRVAHPVRAAARGGLGSHSAVVRFPAILEKFFGVIVVVNGLLTKMHEPNFYLLCYRYRKKAYRKKAV